MQAKLVQDREEQGWLSFSAKDGQSERPSKRRRPEAPGPSGSGLADNSAVVEELSSRGYEVIPDVIENEHGRFEEIYKVKELTTKSVRTTQTDYYRTPLTS